MEAVSGAHGVHNDVGERSVGEPLRLDVIAEGGEVAIESAQFGGAPIVVGGLGGEGERRERRHRYFEVVIVVARAVVVVVGGWWE